MCLSTLWASRTVGLPGGRRGKDLGLKCPRVGVLVSLASGFHCTRRNGARQWSTGAKLGSIWKSGGPWALPTTDAFLGLPWWNPLMTLLPGKLGERFSQVKYLSWRELKIINTLHWMQIAPTALISFSLAQMLQHPQACYGFTMGWVINFSEPL